MPSTFLAVQATAQVHWDQPRPDDPRLGWFRCMLGMTFEAVVGPLVINQASFGLPAAILAPPLTLDFPLRRVCAVPSDWSRCEKRPPRCW